MEKSRQAISAKQAKALDRRAKRQFGISTLVLMENAARAVAEEALKAIADKKARVAIFCGKGNNGGDGFCAARHLLTQGIKPEMFLAGRISEVKNEAKVNLDILLRLKQRVFEVNQRNLYLVKRRITRYNLIVDALLGVGIKGEVGAVYRDLIALINNSSAYILSVDIPSGLDATSGRILGCCVKADKTVTFVAKKSGMIRAYGRQYCGRIAVRDIGVPL